MLQLQFYKEKGFKETVTGKIPKEWQIKTLIEVVDNRDELIVGGPFGSNLKVSDYREEGIPIIRLQNIEYGKFINKDIKFISKEKAEELKYHSFVKGDIILAKLGIPIGKTCIIPDFLSKGIVTADVVRIRPSNKNVNKTFLMHFLNSFYISTQLNKQVIGTTRPRVNLAQVRNLQIILPPLIEQQKIASILSTIDKATEKTDEIIQETEKLKEWLSHELLTKGIGHEEFKDTVIGRIPKEWDIKKLSDIGKIQRGKFSHRPRNEPRFYGGNIPFIQTGDIAKSKGIITEYSQTLNYDGLKISKFFKKGTIVISIAGNIGDVGILGFDACFPDSVVGITVNDDVNRIFLMYLLQSYQKEISSKAPQSTQKNINLEILGQIRIPFPPLKEQKKIADILSVIDKKLELERKEKSRLGLVKAALMDLLLTGKIRVR